MITIRNGGCAARHPSTFILSRPNGLPVYELLIVRTCGDFTVGNCFYHVLPGTAIIFSPFMPYYYQNPSGIYMDDWLHFETDAPDLFLKAGVPTDQPIQLPGTDLYTFLIHQLLWETSYGDSSAKQENTDCLFQLLLNHLHSLTVSAANAARPSSPYHEALQLLRLDLQNAMFHQPSIEKCAKKMGISPSYFQHLYHDFFGISFQKDLIRMRLDLAKHTLINTDLTLHQIAELCGYSTDVHFYRQFRQITGITPAQYRKAQE